MKAFISPPTDDELHELMFLKASVKDMLRRIEEIQDACKAIGSFCTESFVCAVTEQSARRIAGLDDCVEALGMDVLETYGLIHTHYFQVVRVAPRDK